MSGVACRLSCSRVQVTGEKPETQGVRAGSWLSAGGEGAGEGGGAGAGAGAGRRAGGAAAGGGGAAAQQSKGYPMMREVAHWPQAPQLPVVTHQ
jgi:hypothetical protein